jgi:hypothetical protein
MGTIWLGCNDLTESIVSFDGDNWTSYSTTQWSVCNNTFAIFLDSQNRLWFGTSCHGGTLVYDFTQWRAYRTDNSGISNNNVLCITEDLSGGVWLGGYGGLSRFSQEPTANDEAIVDSFDCTIIQQHNTLTVQTSSFRDKMNLDIYSIEGRLLYQVAALSESYSLQLDTFSPGIYFFILRTEGKICSRKVIID